MLSVTAALVLLSPAAPPPQIDIDLGAAREFFKLIETKYDGYELRDPITNRDQRVLAFILLVEATKRWDHNLNIFVVRYYDVQNVEVKLPSSGLLIVQPRGDLKAGERTRFIIPDPMTSKVKKVKISLLGD
jgi:hypothetical protein